MPENEKTQHVASTADHQPRDTFTKALKRFKDGLTEEQKAQFAITSLTDVELEIERIQDQYGPEKRLRSMKKLSKFLEAMSQIEQVVSVFLNVHEAVAFVWGPIKLVLVVASTRLETLESLLDTYVEISEVIPGLRQYDSVFESCPAVREVLELYLCDILQFHSNALAVFARPAWKDIFHSTWKTFRSRFGPIIESLKRHRELLLDERMTAAVIEIQKTRQVVAQHYNDLIATSSTHYNTLSAGIEAMYHELSGRLAKNEERTTQRELKRQHEDLTTIKSSIAKKLDPPDYKGDHQTARNKRLANSGYGVLQDKRFLEWYRGQDLATNILYLHGKPGAGKSIMASSIIDYMVSNADSESPILYFYFRHSDETKSSMRGMLQAILVQLLYQDESLTEFFHRKSSSMSHSELHDLSKLQYLLLETLKSQRICFVVLDGLDECGQNGSKPNEVSGGIIDWFSNHAIPECQAEGGNLRILFCGQRDGVLDKRLSRFPSIGLDSMNSHRQDIRRFTAEKARNISERFCLSSEKRDSIVSKVSGASDGMFLYAKVVLDNLLEQGSEADLDEELNECFPVGLEAAYQRVVIRILDRPVPRNKVAAESILRWIVCAARSLCWREIQSFLCTNPEAGTCDPKRRRVDSCKVICGSLVEVEPCSLNPEAESESIVKLVHATAGSFLVRSGRIQLAQEHTRIALFCSRYLASSAFDPALSADQVIEFASSGYYGSQDYATTFWRHHIKAVLDSPTAGTPQLGNDLIAAVATFLDKFGIQIGDDNPANSTFPVSSAHINGVVRKWHDDTAAKTQSLVDQTNFIRKVIETMDFSKLDAKQQAVFSSLHGVRRFKCTRLHCYHFAIGFKGQSDRNNHISEHERPFKCCAESCYARTIGFSSRVALEAHEKSQHTPESPPSASELFPSLEAKDTKDDIWAACSAGNLNAVKRHIANGAKIHKAKHSEAGGLTPLVKAARNGHLEVCRLLVEHGANVFDAKYKGRSELSAVGEAVRRDDVGFFWALLRLSTDEERDAFAKGDLWPYIRAAIFSYSKTVLPILVSWYSSYSEKRGFGTMLHDAAGRQLTDPAGKECLELMLNHEFPKTIPGYSKNTWYPSLVEKDSRGETALHRACRNGSRPVVTFLIEKLDKDDVRLPGPDGNIALHEALRYSGSDCFISKQLLKVDNGASLKLQNSKGQTSFHLACAVPGPNAARILDIALEIGLDYCSDGNTAEICPLHNLIRYERLEVVRKLLPTGRFDVRRKDITGKTPFSVAAASHQDQRQLMELLLSYDSSLATISDGSPSSPTPLAHAVKAGTHANITFLLGLQEADILIDSSWAHFSSFPVDSLLVVSLKSKRIDLAKRILRDRKVQLKPFKDDYWDTPTITAWNDQEVLPLLFLRQVISTIDNSAETLDRLDAEVQRFYFTEDVFEAWIHATTEIDDSLRFSKLACFAVYTGHKPLVRLLLDSGNVSSLRNISIDPQTNMKLQQMGIEEWGSFSND